MVQGRVQHAWDDSDQQGNISAAQAYLRAIGAVAVDVQADGVSGWWSIDTTPVLREDDVQAHIEDSFMTGEI